MNKSSICYTSFRRRFLFSLLAILVAGILIAVFILMVQSKPAFFDENAKKGVPSDIPEEYGYVSYEAQEVCGVSVCGNPRMDGKKVFLYLTNPESNDVCIRAEIYDTRYQFDENGNIKGMIPHKLLGKTGFIRPGEYTEFVQLKKNISDKKTNIIIKIATYVEDTQESHGFFNINTAFNP